LSRYIINVICITGGEMKDQFNWGKPKFGDNNITGGGVDSGSLAGIKIIKKKAG